MSKGRKVHCLSHLLAPYSEAHRTDCDVQQTFPFSVRCAIEEHKVNAKDRTRVETERKRCLLHTASHAICVKIRYPRLRHATNSPTFLTAMCVKTQVDCQEVRQTIDLPSFCYLLLSYLLDYFIVFCCLSQLVRYASKQGCYKIRQAINFPLFRHQLLSGISRLLKALCCKSQLGTWGVRCI